MSELSPHAQAIKDAVLALYSDEKVRKFGWQLDVRTVTAALRAAAESLGYMIYDYENNEHPSVVSVADILAIADELEGAK